MTERFDSDPRTSLELLAAHRLERADEDAEWHALYALQSRGGRAEFDLGAQLTRAADPADRATGANLLGQIGAAAPAFVAESVDILLGLLLDTDLVVVDAAIVNLGHRADPRAVGPISEFAHHQDADIRSSVAFALGGIDDPLAVSTLVSLARDADRDTRNWAMFGIGTLTDADDEVLRAALVSGLDDIDAEIRGEAIMGLARRRDRRVRDALLSEWQDGHLDQLTLEAAEASQDAGLLPRLSELRSLVTAGQDGELDALLTAAIQACSPK